MKPNPIICLLALLFFSQQSVAQRTVEDPEISKMISEIKAVNLETTVKKLVSFGTRHTLSDTKSNSRGIGAAQRWVKSEFDKYATASNGRLTATIDFFDVKADGRRIANDSKLANVMGTLKGTDANDNRVLIVSGHIDSRVTDVMDAKSDAPGANDDGSGVAAVMELAKIMSKRSYPFTIIFVALTGEEQEIGRAHV